MIPVITALLITTLFIYFVFKPSPFNLIGYSIHEAFWKGGANEANFIKGFDIIVAIILFLITYKITKKIVC